MFAKLIVLFVITSSAIVKTLPTNMRLIEGDIAVPKVLTKSLGEANKQWPGGIVPYEIESAYSLDERNVILAGMQLIMTKTKNCITFVPRDSSHSYWISIQGGLGGCWSYVGKSVRTGEQTLSLSRSGCVYKGIVVHELGHALGFWHEQNRNDRDNYVKINYENIDPSNAFNFDKYGTDKPYLGTPYDYYSIMHYDTFAFSINSKPTIVALQPGVQLIHSALKSDDQILSPIDLQAIGVLYQCKATTAVPITTATTSRSITTALPSTTTTTTSRPITTTTSRPITTTIFRSITTALPATTRPKTTKNPPVPSTFAPFTPFTFVIKNTERRGMYLYWIDYSGNYRFYGAIRPDRSLTQQSYTGHKWVLVTDDNKKFASFTVGENLFTTNNKEIKTSDMSFRQL